MKINPPTNFVNITFIAILTMASFKASPAHANILTWCGSAASSALAIFVDNSWQDYPVTFSAAKYSLPPYNEAPMVLIAQQESYNYGAEVDAKSESYTRHLNRPVSSHLRRGLIDFQENLARSDVQTNIEAHLSGERYFSIFAEGKTPPDLGERGFRGHKLFIVDLNDIKPAELWHPNESNGTASMRDNLTPENQLLAIYLEELVKNEDSLKATIWTSNGQDVSLERARSALTGYLSVPKLEN